MRWQIWRAQANDAVGACGFSPIRSEILRARSSDENRKHRYLAPRGHPLLSDAEAGTVSTGTDAVAITAYAAAFESDSLSGSEIGLLRA
jgi:hypothetical protein